jgi:hypothetical protein
VEVVTAAAWMLERPVWQWCAVVAIAALVLELGVWLFNGRRRPAKDAAAKRRS